MFTFTAYQVRLDGSLSNRENLGNDELGDWMQAALGKFATVKVVCDQKNKAVTYTDKGGIWEIINREVLG